MSRSSKSILVHSRRRKAVTLIEVVASIALVGTLFTVVLIGNSRHLRQLKAAGVKHQACEKLDRLLSRWSVDELDPRRFSELAEIEGFTIGERKADSAWSIKTEKKPLTDIQTGSLWSIQAFHRAPNGKRTLAATVEVVVTDRSGVAQQ
ncbi:MAG: hypothetical protein AAFV88_24360 [Planctomycetota bacterium]